MCFSYDEIHDLFVLISGNQNKIFIVHHFIPDNITAVRLVWRIRHHRGKEKNSLTVFRLALLCQWDSPSFGSLRAEDW